jgi:hypothetical protein
MVDDAAAIPISIPADDAIVIDVPLRPSHGATLRLMVASLGADAGFTIDDLDDLKLAVSEVFTLLVESGEGRARLRILVEDSSFIIEMGTDRAEHAIELDPLSTTILSSVTDDYHVDRHSVRIVKHLTGSTA